jgi:DNA-binding transcriptional LysR family regulator
LPRQPQELKQHACVGRRFPSGAVYAWEFSKDGEPLAIAVDGPLLLDDDELILRAALDGIGLAYVYEAQAQESIEQGRLLRVLDAWCPPMSGFFLYYPSRRQMPATLRLFIAMLRDSGYQ